MKNYHAKCQELLRFIPDLQCYKCKDVPGPKEIEKTRYSCFDSSHTLCEKDKLRCPCGSLVGKNPSPIIANLLQDLPWMCHNYKRGCREIKITISELEFHQRQCIFREVYCPDQNCCKESREIELLFKDITKHLDDCHFDRCIKLKNEGQNVWRVNLTDKKRNFEQSDDLGFGTAGPWYATRSTCGAVFFPQACLKENGIHCWVNFLGSSDDAKNYTVNFSVKSGEVNYGQHTYSDFGDPHSDLYNFIQSSSRYT